MEDHRATTTPPPSSLQLATLHEADSLGAREPRDDNL